MEWIDLNMILMTFKNNTFEWVVWRDVREKGNINEMLSEEWQGKFRFSKLHALNRNTNPLKISPWELAWCKNYYGFKCDIKCHKINSKTVKLMKPQAETNFFVPYFLFEFLFYAHSVPCRCLYYWSKSMSIDYFPHDRIPF